MLTDNTYVIRSIVDVFKMPPEFFEEGLEMLFASLRSAHALGGSTEQVTLVNDGNPQIQITLEKPAKPNLVDDGDWPAEGEG